ncbi:farnesol dehydrogenase-like isoform X2 [Ooceraea biroi]|uniref:farnesol dehydrogenase-like isoform X2 n=1 Tax=Ooceraea biroi TaxID=2015173 RepID=UPI000F09618F|nr:farnesol dehydrogenase-like isoform X2 [Ooceraea biroi]
MDHWEGKVALVTGASVGIGASIARELAKNGMKVIAVARRLEKLQELAANIKDEYKTDIYPMQCDVQKEEDILKVFEWAHEKLGGVDVLVNNAGVVHLETIIEGKTANYHHIMNVNVIAAAICSRELVQSAKRRKTPAHIVNISSMAGHCPELITYPISVYAASKSALNSMAATLRNELINSKLDVKVTNIILGTVETDMTAHYASYIEENNICVLLAKDVADTVVCVLSTPHRVQIHEMIVVPHKA